MKRDAPTGGKRLAAFATIQKTISSTASDG